MSISSSEQSDRIAARLTRAAERNVYPGAPLARAGLPEDATASPIYPELPDTRAWRVTSDTRR